MYKENFVASKKKHAERSTQDPLATPQSKFVRKKRGQTLKVGHSSSLVTRLSLQFSEPKAFTAISSCCHRRPTGHAAAAPTTLAKYTYYAFFCFSIFI